MIVDFILNIFFSSFNFIIGLLPNMPSMSIFDGAFDIWNNFYTTLVSLTPLANTVLLAIIFITVFEFGYLLLSLLNLVLRGNKL